MTSYATVEALIDRIQLDSSVITAESLAVLEDLLDAISRKIDRLCNVPDNYFAADDTTASKYLRGTGDAYLRIPDCFEIDEVQVKDSCLDLVYATWTSPTTAYAGDGDWLPISGTPDNPVYGVTPYTYLIVDPNGNYNCFTRSYNAIPTVCLKAKFGYGTTAPSDIREATLIQVTILFKRFQGSGASTLSTSDIGSLSLRIRRGQMTRDVKELLADGGWLRTVYGAVTY